MKTLYVLEVYTPWDGGAVLGVYSSADKAEVEHKKYLASPICVHRDYAITEYVVDAPADLDDPDA